MAGCGKEASEGLNRLSRFVVTLRHTRVDRQDPIFDVSLLATWIEAIHAEKRDKQKIVRSGRCVKLIFADTRRNSEVSDVLWAISEVRRVGYERSRDRTRQSCDDARLHLEHEPRCPTAHLPSVHTRCSE